MGTVREAGQSQLAGTLAAGETVRGATRRSNLPHDQRCNQARESPPWGARLRPAEAPVATVAAHGSGGASRRAGPRAFNQPRDRKRHIFGAG